MQEIQNSAAPPNLHDSELRPPQVGLPSAGSHSIASILRSGASPASDSRRVRHQASSLVRDDSPSGSRHSPSPRPAPSSTSAARRLPRRRALTACQLCRARKTKCDNFRPSCGYCIFQGVKCVYTDKPLGARVVSPRPSPEPTVSQSGHGPSNEILLDRINHLTGLVEGLHNELDLRRTLNPTTPAFSGADFPAQFGSQDHSLGPLSNQFGASTLQNTESAFADDGFGRLEVPELAARTSACESILKWPVLTEAYPDENITSFPLQSTIRDEAEGDDASMSGNNGGRAVIHEDNIWPLCRKFLILIHVKNPILEVSEFKRYARQAAECGPSWDGRGCLVLLACALASLTTPYHPTQDPVCEAEAADHDMSSPSTAALVDESAAEAYYSAAKRRLGLLPTSLISIQCHYFAGLYEKFAVRPLSAWMLLQQACVRFQAYLYAKALSAPIDGAGARRARHIEQRLYWSCVKAECELRAELQLPASGLLKFKYPDLFPSLSFPSSSELLDFSDGFAGSTGQSPAAPLGSTPASEGGLDPEEERSWLYYLAEIFLRKIMNRILDDVYGRGEQCWAADISRVLSQHAAYSEELALWRAHLPHQIRFSDTEMPPNELAFFLKTRYLICLEWISRPFLYYATAATNTTDIPAAVAALAQRCIEASMALIPVISRHHRHGGIWGLLRKAFSLGLLLIAASRRPLVLRLPDNWRESVRLVTATIKRWEDGATDLRWMRQTLEGMLAAA